MNRPTLIVVSGPPGSGKTTLAHKLAAAIGCPAVCRDEIKEGMAHAEPGYVPAVGDEHAQRTLVAFFGTLELLLQHGVTTLAEAAFQDHVWTPRLEPFAATVNLRIVRCSTDPATTKRRIAEHAATRTAHTDDNMLDQVERGEDFATFRRVEIDAPTIDVDTTDGYEPPLSAIVAFVNA